MSSFTCHKNGCNTDFESVSDWNFDNVTCPKCNTEYEVEYDEICYTDEDGYLDECGWFYLGDEVKK